MDQFDIVVVGAGASGEAAAHYARTRGASVAIVDRALFGGSCPFWACMPSKALLHAAAVHHAGGDYPWSKASDFRDYMINREGTDTPSDAGHVKDLEDAGAIVIRGEASFTGPRRLEVALASDGHAELEAGAVVLAIGSVSRVPTDLPGLTDAGYWTNLQGTSTRELPRSLVILGAGPTGVELSQVYARYGVPVTIVHPRDRVNDRDHPRSTRFLGESLQRDGVTLRLGVRAVRVDPREGTDGAHRVRLSDGSSVDGHQILLAIGRDLPLERLNLAAIGIAPQDGRLEPDDRLRVAENVYVAGDVAGPELHTHLGHYTGEAAVRIALGDDYRPSFDAIPRATYTDPETTSVGLLLEQAQERGIDAQEFTVDIGASAKGYVAEAQGHVTIVVDRSARTLVGAFMAGPAVSEAIHECVLAI
ncbi:MAG: FAD-dependent oxidoreductase, partial [Candidatus Limnocylindria bacterium]